MWSTLMGERSAEYLRREIGFAQHKGEKRVVCAWEGGEGREQFEQRCPLDTVQGVEERDTDW